MNTLWTHHNPVEILAGPDSLNQLDRHAAAGHWLLITTRGATRRGLTARVRALLGPQRRLTVCEDVSPNPQLDAVDELARRYRPSDFHGLIALGGGSTLDTAKVLSVTLPGAQGQHVPTVLREHRQQAWDTSLPVIAIPTTAGTGSEVTPFATVWDQRTHKKYSVTGTRVFPVLAILDPCLTLTLPERQTLYGGLDAASHALESLWNRNGTPISAAFAWQALEYSVTCLPRVLQDPHDLQARQGMQQASLLAGLAISQTRTAIAHSISYPITSRYGVPHGLACSFTLPCLIEDNLPLHDPPQQKILRDMLALLRSLRLDHAMRRYIGDDDLTSLLDQMVLPERAGNYTGDIDPGALLKRALR